MWLFSWQHSQAVSNGQAGLPGLAQPWAGFLAFLDHLEERLGKELDAKLTMVNEWENEGSCREGSPWGSGARHRWLKGRRQAEGGGQVPQTGQSCQSGESQFKQLWNASRVPRDTGDWAEAERNWGACLLKTASREENPSYAWGSRKLWMLRQPTQGLFSGMIPWWNF